MRLIIPIVIAYAHKNETRTSNPAASGTPSCRAKGAIDVVEHDLGALEEDEQIGVVGLAGIGELEGDRDQISARSVEVWPLVDPGVR